MLLLLALFVVFALATRKSSPHLPADYPDTILGTVLHPAASAPARLKSTLTSRARQPTANAVVAATSLAAVSSRWDAMWSTDVSAAEVNVANMHSAAALMARADRGDLEATVDLVGAATWCLSGGPLTHVTDPINDDRRPCFERFGDDLATRERLERASFAWVMRLAAAGVDDATLYASALTRGIGPDLLGGADNDSDLRDEQRALLVGQLQTLAARGSADAASELHGHWSAGSALRLADERLTSYYAALTEQLDPTRSLALVAP